MIKIYKNQIDCKIQLLICNNKQKNNKKKFKNINY